MKMRLLSSFLTALLVVSADDCPGGNDEACTSKCVRNFSKFYSEEKVVEKCFEMCVARCPEATAEVEAPSRRRLQADEEVSNAKGQCLANLVMNLQESVDNAELDECDCGGTQTRLENLETAVQQLQAGPTAPPTNPPVEPSERIFTESTQVAVPEGVSYAYIFLIGGGGGGGSGHQNGGGSGHTYCERQSVQANEMLTVSVGTGGSKGIGGPSRQGAGSNGNTSSVSGRFGSVQGGGGEAGRSQGSGDGGSAGGGHGNAGAAGAGGSCGASGSPGRSGAGGDGAGDSFLSSQCRAWFSNLSCGEGGGAGDSSHAGGGGGGGILIDGNGPSVEGGMFDDSGGGGAGYGGGGAGGGYHSSRSNGYRYGDGGDGNEGVVVIRFE